MFMDSMSRPIEVGDRVLFRGKVYTIKEFMPGRGRFGTAEILFEESQEGHTDEIADEISVDRVQ